MKRIYFAPSVEEIALGSLDLVCGSPGSIENVDIEDWGGLIDPGSSSVEPIGIEDWN